MLLDVMVVSTFSRLARSAVRSTSAGGGASGSGDDGPALEPHESAAPLESALFSTLDSIFTRATLAAASFFATANDRAPVSEVAFATKHAAKLESAPEPDSVTGNVTRA